MVNIFHREKSYQFNEKDGFWLASGTLILNSVFLNGNRGGKKYNNFIKMPPNTMLSLICKGCESQSAE